MNTPDNITISRKTYLDLIAAAEMARAWMAHRAPADNWANNTRQSLNNALSAAIAEQPVTDNTQERDNTNSAAAQGAGH